MTRAAGVQQALEYYGVKLAVRDRIGYHHQALDNTSPDTIGVARYRNKLRRVREDPQGVRNHLREAASGLSFDSDAAKSLVETPAYSVAYHPDQARYSITLDTGAVDTAGRKSPSRFTIPTQHPGWAERGHWLANEVEEVGRDFDRESVRHFNPEHIQAALNAARAHQAQQLRNQRWLRRGAIGATVLGAGLGAKYLYDRATETP